MWLNKSVDGVLRGEPEGLKRRANGMCDTGLQGIYRGEADSSEEAGSRSMIDRGTVNGEGNQVAMRPS